MATVKLKEITLGFAQDLFTPTALMGSKEEKYRCTPFVAKDSENDKKVWAAIRQVISDKWGAKKVESIIESIKGNANKFCYKNGDGTDYDGAEGHMLLSLSNKEQPLLIDGRKNPAGRDKIFSGACCNVNAEIYAYEFEGMKGVAGSIKGVQFVKDTGVRWGGGGTSSEDDFDELGGTEDDENEFA